MFDMTPTRCFLKMGQLLYCYLNLSNNIDVDPKCYFSSKLPTTQSKNLYCSKRDVSATVDMTSSRFFNGSTAILLHQFNIPAMNTKFKIALFVEKHLSATSL